MSDGFSTAKERDDAAKAMTIIKRLMSLTTFRRTELGRTGSFLPSRFCNMNLRRLIELYSRYETLAYSALCCAAQQVVGAECRNRSQNRRILPIRARSGYPHCDYHGYCPADCSVPIRRLVQRSRRTAR